MAKRDKPALPDWHLWSEVAQTVSPLHRTRIREALKLREQPLPLPKTPPGPRHKPVKLPPPMPSYQSSGKPGRQADHREGQKPAERRRIDQESEADPIEAGQE